MLNKLYRIFLIALLLVAIPIQGMAAVSAGICRAVHEGQDAARASTAGHVHEAAHDQAAHGQPAQNAGDESPASDTPSAHCGACAACGAAAAIAPSQTIRISESPADRVSVSPLHPRAGITPAGLDRPPLPHPA